MPTGAIMTRKYRSNQPLFENPISGQFHEIEATADTVNEAKTLRSCRSAALGENLLLVFWKMNIATKRKSPNDILLHLYNQCITQPLPEKLLVVDSN